MKTIFIVGSSRSGTTMMGRILGRHSAVFTFNELHFFEQLWDPTGSKQALSPDEAAWLGARLLTIQRDGYYTQKDPWIYLEEGKQLVRNLGKLIHPLTVFKAMMDYETNRNGKQVACDQTPRNVLYLQEILDLHPEAYIVHMIRDSRDVLLSQKNRWRRRFLGGNAMPLREIIRSWANYHPITISMLWNSAIHSADKFRDHPHVFQLKFEDFIMEPKGRLEQLCAFVGLEFHVDMLEVTQVGSSHEYDKQEQTGIRQTAAGRWQRDTINQFDLAVCQYMTRPNLLKLHYDTPSYLDATPLQLMAARLTWPVKISVAFLLNINRVRNLYQAIRRRWDLPKSEEILQGN